MADVFAPHFEFHALPSHAFPLKVHLRRADNDAHVWVSPEIMPGADPLQVPPLAHELGVALVAEIHYADGTVLFLHPPCACEHEWSHHFDTGMAEGFCDSCPCQDYRPVKPASAHRLTEVNDAAGL